MSTDPAVLEYAEPKRPLAIPSQRTEEDNAHLPRRAVRYVRGRVSQCKQLADGSISVRAENTLLSRPFSGEFDLVSLSTGMRPCENANELARILGIGYGPDGFFLSREWLRHPHDATRDGVFLAGCATGMKPIRNCMIDGSAVAARVIAFLREAAARASAAFSLSCAVSCAFAPAGKRADRHEK